MAIFLSSLLMFTITAVAMLVAVIVTGCYFASSFLSLLLMILLRSIVMMGMMNIMKVVQCEAPHPPQCSSASMDIQAGTHRPFRMRFVSFLYVPNMWNVMVSVSKALRIYLFPNVWHTLIFKYVFPDSQLQIITRVDNNLQLAPPRELIRRVRLHIWEWLNCNHGKISMQCLQSVCSPFTLGILFVQGFRWVPLVLSVGSRHQALQHLKYRKP